MDIEQTQERQLTIDEAIAEAEKSGTEQNNSEVEIINIRELLPELVHPVVASIINHQQEAINLLESDIAHLKSLIKTKHAPKKNNDKHR